LPTHRGFILQPTYRVESGRPVVHLYGTLEDGRPFLVRDRRPVPHFYVERKYADQARALGAVRQVATDQVTLTGEPVVAIEVATPSDTPPLRDRLIAAGIATHEADIRFAMRYLIDRGIRGTLEIHGDGRLVPGLGLVFEEPEIAPADWTPRLRVLSLDIAPVLLGSGERIFDGVKSFGFEPAEVLHSPLTTHIRYRRVS
jgi:DNA polymerase-2